MVQFNYNGLSKSSGVYIIFNNHNWRLYVGSTVEFKNRWTVGHYKSLLKEKHSNKFLQADFLKCRELLGHDDFLEFHVLEHIPNSTREERLQVEEKWLKIHFDGGKNCYNLTDKAISREGFSDKKIRKNPWIDHVHPRLGTHHTEETKKKISEHHLSTGCLKGENHPMFGKKQSEKSLKQGAETRKRLQVGMYGKSQSDKQKKTISLMRSKSVGQFDQQGILIRFYKSAFEAECQTGISKCSISLCCNGKRKTAGKFIWKFTKDCI